MAVLDFFHHRRTVAQQLPEQVLVHLQRAAGHDVVERGHAAKQRNILEGAGDTAIGGVVGPHLGARLAFEGDNAFLRLIKSVDDIEHRRLAGAIRADDGADLAFANIERYAADGFDAAK